MTAKTINPDLHEGLLRTVFSREQLAVRVRELGQQITQDYAGRHPLVVGILRGSFVFLADLVRAIDLQVEVDFIAVSSYGNAARSSGVVQIVKDLSEPLEGRHVILVEDIVDTGLTLRYLLDNLATRHPASLAICSLLDKREARIEPVNVDYIGFPCPNEFLVGYGLDYSGLYRNLPEIAVLSPHIYQGS